MSKTDVLCVGSATLDHFLTIDRSISSIKLGDKVLVSSLEMHSGGGATNAGAALAKLGVRVKILTKLGNDHAATIVKKELHRYGLTNLARTSSKKSTDVSTIISSTKEKDRVIYVHKGASLDLTEHDFTKSDLNVRWIYLATLLGKSFQTAKKIAAYAQQKEINLLFNPSLYLAKQGIAILNPVLRATTILVLNKEEAQALLKSTAPTPLLLQKLHHLGPKTVIITDGSRKLYAYAAGTIYSLLPPNVKIVHTAGAGDAFTAGFLAGIIKKYSLEDALRLGQVNSTAVIQDIGAKSKLVSEREAQKMIKKYNIKVYKNR
ncbi:MAG: carbohydrate kinase family protein [Nanoarchaeota archaeon]|nr:carbohydrate kinase family protein [Nanoarchaeota archaeon]